MTMRSRVPWVVRWMWLWGPLTTLIVFGGPALMLHLVTSEAERCFASIPTRAQLELPDCARRQEYLARLLEVPFVGRPATRAREELIARMAVWRYIDAAIGEPNRDRLTKQFEPLQPAAYMIWEGSMRLRMDEVGPPMPVPEPGALAFGVGDRVTLDDRAFDWTQHYTETRAMEAALLEGRLERAVRLAEHYQGRPNTELRVRVGALLCLGGQHARGIDQVDDVAADRAGYRTANFSRNYGGARVVHEACARAAKADVPPPVVQGDAGQLDHRARLMTMRMRNLRIVHPACDWSDPMACRRERSVGVHLDGALEMLRTGVLRRHRLALFASVADALTSVAVARDLGEPRRGEVALADSTPGFADQWLAQEADAPFVSAEQYERAALHLSELTEPESIAGLIEALWVRAVVGYAQQGNLGAADRCIVQAKLTEPAVAITRANAALVAGDRAEARRRSAAEAPRHPLLLVLRAGLAQPDEDLARARALEALQQAADSRLIERIRWLLVSLGVPTRGRTTLGPENLRVPPRYRYAGRRNALTSDETRSDNLDDTLAVWHRWLGDEDHRRTRYQAFAHRGDAPSGLTPWLHAGAKLSSKHFSDEQTEMWLDALLAFDARRFSLRQVAFARWRAAAWRADSHAASVWHGRYRKLAELSQDPDMADLLRALRI